MEAAVAPSNNLPLDRTRFVGREELLRGLQALALQPDARLITLTGPGGTGKTRLALRAASELIGHFAAGVYFVPLAAVTDPEVVIPTLARTLGLKEIAGQSMRETLLERVADRTFLLILDNFEQVMGAAPAVSELLSTCPRLSLLVTSRAVLHLAGEREFPVPPLTVPDTRSRLSAQALARNEAAVLFLERARAARPDFDLTDENAAAVAEVCRLLDGLPLAIELAAARLRALPLPALLGRLERRLPILTGGPSDAPMRQHTLRDTIAWSYDLLVPDEQALFRRLGVFRGCTLDAVEAVCCAPADGPRSSSVAVPPLAIDALDGVTSLVERSLLRRDETADGQPWYVMLETVREFALEQLEAGGVAAALRRRHALYYLRLSEDADQKLHGPGQVELLDRLEREHHNCREALSWCTAQGYAEPALRIATALWWFWYVHGYAGEGRDWLTSLLERFKGRPQVQLRALEAAGHLASFQGDLVAARALHQKSLLLAEEMEDATSLYLTLQNLGFVTRQQNDLQAARSYFERCLAVARMGGDPDQTGNALHNLGNVVHDLGDHELACALLEESVPLFAQTGLVRSEAIAHLSLGIVAADRGDFERARRESEQAVELMQQAGDQRQYANALANLASITTAVGDFDTAQRHLCDSLRALQDVGDTVAIARVLERFAVWWLAARNESRRALRLAGAAGQLRDSNGGRLEPATQWKLDADLAPAREALGPAGAASAYAAGRELSASDAITEAFGTRVSSPLVASESHGAAAGAGSDLSPAMPLTTRELEIASLVASGATNKRIADALVITEGTAANHVLHILNKLGFSSRTQIAVWITRQGLPAATALSTP
ncbi:MAG: ATP-binding protein [Chloroflexota bacterium]